MSNLDALPEWVNAIASSFEPKARRKITRKMAQRLRAENRIRTKTQRDGDDKPFIKPLKRENDPMFREITALRYFKAKGTDNEAIIGYGGHAGRIAKIHHEGQLNEVRPHSKKYPYPERTLVGITKKDHEMILALLQDELTQDL